MSDQELEMIRLYVEGGMSDQELEMIRFALNQDYHGEYALVTAGRRLLAEVDRLRRELAAHEEYWSGNSQTT